MRKYQLAYAELYEIGQTVCRTVPKQSCESHENYFLSEKENIF